jgi:hypothetical protein
MVFGLPLLMGTIINKPRDGIGANTKQGRCFWISRPTVAGGKPRSASTTVPGCKALHGTLMPKL